jgi:hypothetical protein
LKRVAIVPKPLRYTGHAEDSITERELDRSWIEETVRRPDWSAPDPRQAGVERRFRVIPAFGGRILRVACFFASLAWKRWPKFVY